MRIFIYGILILIAMAALADPEKVHHKIDLLMQDEEALKKQADDDMQEWENGMTADLLIHDSPNVRIFAIRRLINPLKKLNSESPDFKKIDELNDFIYKIMEDEHVGAQALHMLSAFCDNEQKLYQCNHDRITEKLIELEPNNSASYVILLNKAIKTENVNAINSVLSDMAKATYHNHHFTVLPELEKAVFDYVDKYPLPQSTIDSSLEIFGLEDTKLHYSQQELEENLVYSMLIGIGMAIPMPSYRVFTQTCKDMSSSKEQCLKIADTLINHSFTLIAKKIGYAIIKEIYKTSGDDSLYLITKNADEKFSKEYTCITKSLYSDYQTGHLMTTEKFQLSNKAEIQAGELARFKKLAELHYQENSEKGNHDAINPVSCYQ